MANPFKAMKNANRAQAKILRRDTASDFHVTQGGLDAILANLTTTQTGLGRKLTRVNARGLEAMTRTSARSDKRMDKIVTNGQNIIDNRFGSVIGQDPNLLRGTARLASSQAKVNKGQLKAGELQMRGANEAMDILAEAGQTAMDAGQYELAMALRERQTADAETVAASALALQQQKLDAKLNERYLRLQTKLSTGGSGGEGFESAAQVVMGLANEGASPEQLAANIKALAIQYNLGPEAARKLAEMATQLGGVAGAGGAGGVGSPAAQAYLEEHGETPATALGPTFEKAANDATWKAFDPAKDVPTLDEALTIIGVSRDPETGKYMDGAMEVDEDQVAAAVAYVQSTWMRISAKASA